MRWDLFASDGLSAAGTALCGQRSASHSKLHHETTVGPVFCRGATYRRVPLLTTQSVVKMWSRSLVGV